MSAAEQPIQNFYNDEAAICYGCGWHNAHGHHIQTYWNGAEGVARFTPEAYHTAFPGFVYGGLLASLIDCHSMGTAIAHAYQREDRQPGSEPEITYVTGSLNIRYLRPTPIGVELEIRARVSEWHERKAVVVSSIYADGEECVHGEVIAIRVGSRLTMGDQEQ